MFLRRSIAAVARSRSIVTGSRCLHSGGGPDHVSISKASIGAGVVGWACGYFVPIGPYSSSVLAAAAVYATGQRGQIGATARTVGRKTYNGMEDGYKWLRSTFR